MINADTALKLFGKAGGYLAGKPILTPVGLYKRKRYTQQNEKG